MSRTDRPSTRRIERSPSLKLPTYRYPPSGLNAAPSARPPTSASPTFVTRLPSIASSASLLRGFAYHAARGTAQLPFRSTATARSPRGLIARPSGPSPPTTRPPRPAPDPPPVDRPRRARLEVDHAHRVDVAVRGAGRAVVGDERQP